MSIVQLPSGPLAKMLMTAPLFVRAEMTGNSWKSRSKDSLATSKLGAHCPCASACGAERSQPRKIRAAKKGAYLPSAVFPVRFVVGNVLARVVVGKGRFCLIAELQGTNPSALVSQNDARIAACAHEEHRHQDQRVLHQASLVLFVWRRPPGGARAPPFRSRPASSPVYPPSGQAS